MRPWVVWVAVGIGWWTGASVADETRFEPRLTLSFPYLLEPVSGTGDTALAAGLAVALWPGLLIDQELGFGIVGRHGIRYAMVPTARFRTARALNPEIGAGGIVQFRPGSRAGVCARAGLSWEPSRTWNLWYMRFSLGTGLSLFLDRPRLLEIDLIRLSVVRPF